MNADDELMSPDNIYDVQETVKRFLDIFDENGSGCVDRLNVLTTLISYTYLTELEDEMDEEDFVMGYLEVLMASITIVSLCDLNEIRNGESG